MAVAEAPVPEQPASRTTWVVGLAVVTVAASVMAFAPPDPRGPQKGDVVSYNEDLIGRPWRVVGQHEFGRYVISNGRVRAIAEADDISPYNGQTKNLTVQMIGQYWQERLVDAQPPSQPDRAIAASKPGL